jgi:DNA repair protein RadD
LPYQHDRQRNYAKQFEVGALKVVCNVGCLTTGVDWDVRCIILARPTKSEILFVQMIGRGLRTAEGKADCLILDHSDNHLRLGFVTDIHHDELDDGRERQKAKPQDAVALPKKCPSCSFLKPPKLAVCPCCGFKPEPKCQVVNRDGELVEFAARGRVKPAVPVPERQAFYQQLKAIRVQRGFASGWIANKYREKFGEWPPRTFEALAAMEPSAATRSWVRSRAIAYAKAMEAHR